MSEQRALDTVRDNDGIKDNNSSAEHQEETVVAESAEAPTTTAVETDGRAESAAKRAASGAVSTGSSAEAQGGSSTDRAVIDPLKLADGLGSLRLDTRLEGPALAEAGASQEDRRSMSSARASRANSSAGDAMSSLATGATTSRQGEVLYYGPEGELYKEESGKIYGRMRPARAPPMDDRALAALAEHVDRVVESWRAYTGGHDVALPLLRKVKRDVEGVALRVAELAAEYEACMKQRNKLSDDIGAAIGELKQLLRTRGHTEAQRAVQQGHHDQLVRQLTEVLAGDVGIKQDYAEVERLRNKTTHAYIQMTDVAPVYNGRGSDEEINDRLLRGLSYATATPPVAMTANGAFYGPPPAGSSTVPPGYGSAVPPAQQAATATTGSNGLATTRRPATTTTSTPPGVIDLTTGPTDPYETMMSGQSGSSGPRARVDRWKDMTKIRTKLRQLKQAISSFPTSQKRQYLCQALPAEQNILVQVRRPDGSLAMVDVCTLAYHDMVAALLSKFDTADDREAVRAKLQSLRMKTPVGEQQLADYPTYFHDNVYWPLLEACHKADEFKDDQFSAEAVLRSLPIRLRAEVKMAVRGVPEDARDRQTYLEAASSQWRDRGESALHHYFQTEEAVCEPDGGVTTTAGTPQSRRARVAAVKSARVTEERNENQRADVAPAAAGEAMIPLNYHMAVMARRLKWRHRRRAYLHGSGPAKL
jgi:hypothetical protein